MPHLLCRLQPGLLLMTASLMLFTSSTVAQPLPAPAAETSADWYRSGAARAAANREQLLQALLNAHRPAKNVILFVGDGMGPVTVTAARIYAGQKQGRSGEEHALTFEQLPHSALVKTYNVDQQVSDSAGTMTAIITGVKTNAGMISVGPETTRGVCGSGPQLMTALEYAELAGMATGVVSTARITHATPAATYAKSPERDYESDADADTMSKPGDCKDIATQLIELDQREYPQHARQIDGIEVVLGGGRRNFLPAAAGGRRQDGRDLIKRWQQRNPDGHYVSSGSALAQLEAASDQGRLLGLFSDSHMAYELDRASHDDIDEPSLAAMTAAAIRRLQTDADGFFLHVEAGRIDHAHHATNPIRALEDVLALDAAVAQAMQLTDAEETLIIVTADHSHVMSMAGYPTRGNPILGKVVGNDMQGQPLEAPKLDADGYPYTTLGYINGIGFAQLPGMRTADAIYGLADHDADALPRGRVDLRDVDTTAEGFHPPTLVPLGGETHGGEDVAVYASGPGASLLDGVIEQHVIYHVMNLAARLEQRAGR
ncbi:MAG: alkaline phosphatase [Gammaproteobacteria bacterium]|nr:alkaline phosphatase [Gammaproteobacteria bacterium]